MQKRRRITMQHRFKTESGEYLAVAVQDDATQFMIDTVWPDVHESIECLFFSRKDEPLFYNENKCIILPDGQYEIIGPYPGLTEEQATEVVNRAYDPEYWENYHKSTYCVSALESFASLMEAERLYTENPLGDEPKLHYSMEDNYDHYQWNLAEDRTSKQWIILKLK